MDPDLSTTFTVRNCEVSAIPGTGYAFIRLALEETPLQAVPEERRYVFSLGQLAELREEIDAVLRLSGQPVRDEPPLSHLH